MKRICPYISIVAIFFFIIIGSSYLASTYSPTSSTTSASALYPADLNDDNVVNISDLSLLISKWGTTDTTADVNDDGTVNIFDLSFVVSRWGAVASQESFVHPGILVSSSQLSFVKNKIAAGEDPWKTFYAKLQTAQTSLGTTPNTPFTSLSYTPHPVSSISCPAGPASGAPASCADEKNDAIAAYADILMYNYSTASNREDYAQKAVQILNAWSAALPAHPYGGSGDTGNYNAPLQASWAGSIFAKAGELVRHTYTPSAGKTAFNVAQFNKLLDIYVPLVNQVYPGGGANWIMSMNEATMNIGIFKDDPTLYNDALARWRAQVPSIIYLTTDTNDGYVNLKGKGYPIPPPGVSWVNANTGTGYMNSYWNNPSSYINGLEGETCRDPAHMAMGFGAMTNIAETARIQGVDLYGEQKDRLVAGLELNTGYLVSFLGGSTPANWVCPNAMDPVSNSSWKVTFEIAYNAYANRLGVPMPNTLQLLTQYSRASSYKTDFGMNFEGLTSAGTP